MSFWADSVWRDAGKTLKVVRPFDDSALDDSKYKLAVGKEVFLSRKEANNTVRALARNEWFFIRPGEFAFILTEEIVDIPLDCLGFISMSTNTKFYGLVNVSGFHVDPGYEGRLIFAVFNSGPNAIHLQRGERIFSLWIAYQSGKAAEKKKAGFESIPTKIVNQLQGETLTAYQLSEKIENLDGRIKTLEHTAMIVKSVAAVAAFFLAVAAVFGWPTISSWFSGAG